MSASSSGRKIFSRGCLPFIATAFCAGVAYGTPHGELDGSFGANGRMTLGPVGEITLGSAVVQQPVDGKLIVAGTTWVTPSQWYDFLVIRLNPDGSPDLSFGTDGTVRIEVGGGGDIATDVAIQADGKIVVAGYAEVGAENYDLALTRLNPDGSIDSTFGDRGRATLALGGNSEYIAKIVLLPNGKIVVAGGTNVDGDFDVVFARFNANGALDTSFGTGLVAGTTRVDLGNSQDQPYSMTMQPDGKFIACGQSGPNAYDATGGQMLAIRVNADGSVDAGFGANGVSIVATGGPRGGGTGCVAMPDGKTVLAGFTGNTRMEDLLLARLASNGVLDTTFGSAGLSRIDLGGSESVQSIIRLADGKLGVTGLTGILNNEFLPNHARWGFDAPSERSHTLFARIDANSGVLDPDFGNNGVTLVDFGRAQVPSMAFGRGLIQQADGKLLAVGENFEWGDWWNYHQIALARVDPAGAGNAGIASLVDVETMVREGTAPVVLSVRRTGGIVGNLSVDYSTLSSSATESSDYTATSGTLTWLSGDTAPKSITVAITDDKDIEMPESFRIVLSSPGNHVGFASAAVFIDDNDLPSQRPSRPTTSSGGGGIGGGATGMAELLTLALISAFATHRRRRRLT